MKYPVDVSMTDAQWIYQSLHRQLRELRTRFEAELDEDAAADLANDIMSLDATLDAVSAQLSRHSGEDVFNCSDRAIG